MIFLGGYQSGQMGQTVNLLVVTFGGSNPSPPTAAMPVQAECRKLASVLWRRPESRNFKEIAAIAQLVEHDLAKVGVASSSLVCRSLGALVQSG